MGGGVDQWIEPEGCSPEVAWLRASVRYDRHLRDIIKRMEQSLWREHCSMAYRELVATPRAQDAHDRSVLKMLIEPVFRI